MQFDLREAREVLANTPNSLNALLSHLSDNWTKTNEGPETWSPYDVLGHLIHGEKTDWIPRAKIILSEGPKEFEPFDRFAMLNTSKGKSMEELLTEFSTWRNHNLEELETLNIQPDDWNKTGIHPFFGEITLRNLLSTWVAHDLNHIYQIVRVMAKRYRKDTGPWPAYIKLLNE